MRCRTPTALNMTVFFLVKLLIEFFVIASV